MSLELLAKIASPQNQNQSNEATTSFVCPHSECRRIFTSKRNLVDHFRGHHSGSKPHICTFPQCGKSFLRPAHLAIHYRIHTGEKPFVCEYSGCGKRWNQKSALKQHLRSHTGEKPFACSTCGKSFSTSSSCKRHALTHDRSTPINSQNTPGFKLSAEEDHTTGSSGNNSDATPSSPVDVSSEFSVPTQPSMTQQYYPPFPNQQFPFPQQPPQQPYIPQATTITITPPLPSLLVQPPLDFNFHNSITGFDTTLKRKASTQDPQDILMWNNNSSSNSNNSNISINVNVNNNAFQFNSNGSISPKKKRALSPVDIVVSTPATPQNSSPQNYSSPPTSPSSGGITEEVSMGNQGIPTKMSVSFLLN